MREQTNSITKLVKIVAKEEVLKVLEEYRATKRNKCPKNVRNAGEYWNKAEDDILKTEFSAAVKQIANRHGRSFGAIIARLHQKGMIVYY